MNGIYTSKEAIARLGIPITTFHWMVRHKKINRYVPPGESKAVYSKKEIDALAEAREKFRQQFEVDSVA